MDLNAVLYSTECHLRFVVFLLDILTLNPETRSGFRPSPPLDLDSSQYTGYSVRMHYFGFILMRSKTSSHVGKPTTCVVTRSVHYDDEGDFRPGL